MEKSVEEKQKQYSERSSSASSKGNIWDCGSMLYDSYELNSFKRQLDSAIANSPRTLSMPHLTQRHVSVSVLQQTHHHEPLSSQRVSNNNNKSLIKITRTFQKLIRFVFKSGASKSSRVSNSSSNRSNSFRSAAAEKYAKEDRYCVVYDKSEPVLLSTIPELPDFEIGGISPDISAFVRKSTSERFTATAIGISCA